MAVKFVCLNILFGIYAFSAWGWSSRAPHSVGMEPSALESFVDYAFPSNMDWKSRQGRRTHALLVIKDGALVLEKYRDGFGPDKRHHAWSVSKLLANALVGVSERKSILSRDSLVSQWIALPPQKDLQKMTITHLLFWSSGLAWNESYEGNPLRSSVLAMLYGQDTKDVGEFVAQFPQAHSPGERESYSSGDTNLISYVLRKALNNDAEYWEFPWKEIFNPLGINSAVIERDQAGTFLLSSYAHMTPRDLAKLGWLYVQDGVWEGKRILPKGWVSASTELSPSFRGRAKGSHSSKPLRGMHLWTNKENTRLHLHRPFPDVPTDMFAALGHWGQSMVMIPSEGLVIVRMADDRDESFDMNQFLKLLLNSLSHSKSGASRP